MKNNVVHGNFVNSNKEYAMDTSKDNTINEIFTLADGTDNQVARGYFRSYLSHLVAMLELAQEKGMPRQDFCEIENAYIDACASLARMCMDLYEATDQ